MARNPSPRSRNRCSPASASSDGLGNARLASPGSAILLPNLDARDSTFPLILGMLEVAEHMNETRHSHGSCRSSRMPLYRDTADRI